MTRPTHAHAHANPPTHRRLAAALITLATPLAATLAVAPSPARAQTSSPVRTPDVAPQSAQLVDPAAPPAAPPEAELVDLEEFLRGEGRGITAEEAARRAVETAPGIEASRAQLQAAQAGASRALVGFFPRLEITGRYTRLSPITQPTLFSGSSITDEQIALIQAQIDRVTDPAAQALFQADLAAQIAQAEQFGSFSFPVILDQWALQATLQIPVTDIFLQVWPAYEAAQGAARAQEHQIRARSAEVAQNAREAYYAYARARGVLAVARQAVGSTELQARLIDAMVRAGTAARVDLVRMEAQVAAAQVASINAEAGVRISQTALRTLMHVDPDVEIGVAEDLLEPMPPLDAEREGMIAQAYERRAEARALRELIGARGHQVDAAEGSRWPHLFLAGNFYYQNPNQRIFPMTAEFRETWDVSALISWSPNDFFTGEFQAAEARAARTQAEADLRTLEDGIRLQVTQAYENYRASRAAIEAARTGVEAADETLRVRQEQYRAGATVVTELVLAVTDRARRQLDLINAALDARVAYTQLQRAIGADTPYEREAGARAGR